MLPNLTAEQERKILKAKIGLYKRFPFFAVLVSHLRIEGSTEVETAAIDAKGRMRINPEFLDKASVQDTQFILCHEAMHLAQQSWTRMPSSPNLDVWNIATDCTNNYMLVKSNLPLPNPQLIQVVYGGEYAKYDNWPCEAVYSDLIKRLADKISCPQCNANRSEAGGDSSSKSDCGGHSMTKDIWWDDSGSSLSPDKVTPKQAIEWRRRVACAAEAAKTQGNLPGVLQEFTKELLAPKKDWQKVLLNIACRSLKKGIYTWKKRGRRCSGFEWGTPGRNPHAPNAAIYMDTSGSMSREDILRCFSETAALMELAGGDVILLLGDSEIYYFGEADINVLKNLKLQRGGTDFRVIFEKIKEEMQLPPDLLICFSDLHGPFPAEAPDYPVVWCSIEGENNGTAPWGEMIEVPL